MIEFSSGYLLKIRRKALRRHVWFTVLDRAERAILNLVPKCVDRARSPALIDVVAKIIVKIQEALRSPLERFRNQVAKPLAQKISQIAQKWGYKNATEWAEDKAFIQYLAIGKMNDNSIIRAGHDV